MRMGWAIRLTQAASYPREQNEDRKIVRCSGWLKQRF
jgi:hypothetical protein